MSWNNQADSIDNQLIIEFGYKPGTASTDRISKTKDESGKKNYVKLYYILNCYCNYIKLN